MAQIVNLRESEYQIIVSELSQMHSNQLTSVKEFIEEMKMMVTSQEIFYVNRTSTKMVDMLEILSYEIVPVLERAFQDSEVGVANMIESTITIDSTHN